MSSRSLTDDYGAPANGVGREYQTAPTNRSCASTSIPTTCTAAIPTFDRRNGNRLLQGLRQWSRRRKWPKGNQEPRCGSALVAQHASKMEGSLTTMGAYGSGGSLGLQNRWGRRKATGRFDSYTLPPESRFDSD